MNTAAAQKNWEGQLIDGRFPLLQWLGGSEHSAVFLTELGGNESRKAAIKFVPADAATANTRISRWEMALGLSHPHLVRLFHTGQCEIEATPLVYVVMEYAEEDLSQVVPLRALTAAEAAEMLPPILDVLSYIHEKRLVHGHIKPSNVMVVDNRVKLSSDSVQPAHEPASGGLKLDAYHAPEIATGAVLPAADVWSLGVTLVTALTQHPPAWQKSESGELILPVSVPEPIRAIVRECLRHDPAKRCTLEQIRDRLQPPSTPLKRIEKPGATARPKRRVVTPIIAGLIVLATLAGIRLLTHHSPSRPTPASSAAEQAAGGTVSQPAATANPATTTESPKRVAAPGAVVERVLPDVPQSARNTIRGNVRVGVRVSVDPAGKVVAASLDAPGPSKYFANLALQAARGWKFQAPRIDRDRVASEWILRFQFGQTETQVVPVQVTP